MTSGESGALARALSEKKTIVCVGSGGVGKTTVSAALALRAATLGSPSVVCTIDPARRLANSLGLAELGNAEREIPASAFEAAGVEAKAPMRALMLDMKQTWDDLIGKAAPPELRDRILENRFYQSLSTALAGSQEYIALEKLWDLRQRRPESLIVLDTPPTAHALDFLDAPNRILDFLDNDAARLLLAPALKAGRFGLKLFNLGGNLVAKTLTRFTGIETLQALSEFLLSLSGLNEGFRQRARDVRALLEDPKTGFVLVTSPARERIGEAENFQRLLRENRMSLTAVVVNRVHPHPPPEAWEAVKSLEGELQQKVLKTLEEARSLAEVDGKGVEELKRRLTGVALIEVPRFSSDVHDLAALWRTSSFLVGESKLA